MSIQKKAVYKFKTPDDITSISREILRRFPCLQDSETAILELMVNAVEHGNLGISYEEKTKLLKKDMVADEIAKRLNGKAYSDRTASIEIEELDEEIIVSVSDEGNGFDWQPYLDTDITMRKGFHGRGIPLSLQFTKSLTYVGNGNKVIAVFNSN